MTKEDQFRYAIDLVRKFVPQLTITQKAESRLHRFIGTVLGKVGNKQYMESYVTTIGTDIAIPTGGATWPFLLHEGQHAIDGLRTGKLLYSIGYLFPQIIGMVGAVLTLPLIIVVACGAPVSLLWLLTSLLFLLPWPAPFRALSEARAYALTLAVLYWANTIKDKQKIIDALVKTFSDSCYYWMWPFKKMVRKYFEGKLDALKTGTLELNPYYAACRTFALDIKAKTNS